MKKLMIKISIAVFLIVLGLVLVENHGVGMVQHSLTRILPGVDSVESTTNAQEVDSKVPKGYWVDRGIKLKIEPNPTFLMYDSQFSSTNFTLDQTKTFFRSYPGNKFSDDEIKYIYSNAIYNRVHIVVVATKLEQENNLTRNAYTNNYKKRLSRAMAYGLTHRKWSKKRQKFYCPHVGFYRQIRRGVRLLRKYYDEYKPGCKIKIYYAPKETHIRPDNAATYTLYKFCPVFGEYVNVNKKCVGNKMLILIHKRFLKRWNKLNPTSQIRS